jgi:hypothetical protein
MQPQPIVEAALGLPEALVQGQPQRLPISEHLLATGLPLHADAILQPPAVDIRLQQSAFGLSEMFDRLELSTKEIRYVTQFHVTTPMILALIEGVLGYTLLSGEGGTWTFRRETELRLR